MCCSTIYIYLLHEEPLLLLLLDDSQSWESVLQPPLRVLQLLSQPVVLVLKPKEAACSMTSHNTLIWPQTLHVWRTFSTHSYLQRQHYLYFFVTRNTNIMLFMVPVASVANGESLCFLRYIVKCEPVKCHICGYILQPSHSKHLSRRFYRRL